MAQEAQTLGQFVRAHREARRWTQTDLAGRAGMRQSYISALEGDEIGIPGRDKLNALARAFNLRVADFYRVTGVLEGLDVDAEAIAPSAEMVDEFFRLHPDLIEDVAWAKENLPAEDFVGWRRDTFLAWAANLRLSIAQLRRGLGQ